MDLCPEQGSTCDDVFDMDDDAVADAVNAGHGSVEDPVAYPCGFGVAAAAAVYYCYRSDLHPPSQSKTPTIPSLMNRRRYGF